MAGLGLGLGSDLIEGKAVPVDGGEVPFGGSTRPGAPPAWSARACSPCPTRWHG